MRKPWAMFLVLSACGGSSAKQNFPVVVGGDAGVTYFGNAHTGNFWEGPVDFAETKWPNACAPSTKYPQAIRDLYGNFLMGFAQEVTLGSLSAGGGELCDVCVELSANGKTAVAHAITYGQETGPNDIDISPELIAFFGAPSPPNGSWRVVSCPTTAPIVYTFDGRQWDNTWFFRVWIRNARLPVAKVEYQLGGGAWQAIGAETDGAYQASSQDFRKGFSLRVTAVDGQTVVDGIPGLNTFNPDVGIASHTNFQ
jgi:hypothetical protein